MISWCWKLEFGSSSEAQWVQLIEFEKYERESNAGNN